MPTSPDPTTGRGGSLRWLAALGLVLAGIGVALPWAASLASGGSSAQPSRQSVVPVSLPLTTESSLDEYVAAPPVQLATRPEPTTPKTPSAAPGVPRRLVVPDLGVDAPVIPITAPGGVLLPPSDPQTLGWWRDGAKPGARTGGALISGHTVHTGGGAFDDLETLRPGVPVRVRTDRGVLNYEVLSVTVYRKATLARDAQKIFSQTLPGRLVLITCEDWNGSGYDSNAVVVATRV